MKIMLKMNVWLGWMGTIFTNLQRILKPKNCKNILHLKDFNCYFYFLHPIPICNAYSIHNLLCVGGRCADTKMLDFLFTKQQSSAAPRQRRILGVFLRPDYKRTQRQPGSGVRSQESKHTSPLCNAGRWSLHCTWDMNQWIQSCKHVRQSSIQLKEKIFGTSKLQASIPNSGGNLIEWLF